MAIANIHETLLCYTMEKADITNRLSTIMSRITLASMENMDRTEEVNAKRNYYSQKVMENPDYADTQEYKILCQQIENDYNLQLSEINSWECQLEQEKNNLETRLKVIESFEESWNSILKSNIKRDFGYFQNQQ